jgi:hypothetical protein
MGAAWQHDGTFTGFIVPEVPNNPSDRARRFSYS